MCLVHANASEHYAALSYVWGNSTEKVDRIFASGSDLYAANALAVLDLPSTIRDAITLVHELGIGYLWVDALCILQNEPSVKAMQIGRMDAIYRQADVTIVAACGGDANAGLVGVPPIPRKVVQHKVSLHGNDFLKEIYDLNYTGVKGSNWRQRAWTLQEDVFSSRRIVFTDEQVYWTCQEKQYAEEYAT